MEYRNLQYSLFHRANLWVFLILISGLLLRGVAISHKQTLTHDESISYLAATANQGAYQKAQDGLVAPYATWVSTAEWKSFFIPQRPFAFSQISDDLANFDIHPPLYFWLLHLWTLLFGVQTWTGPTLNLLLFSIAVFALYGLARRLLKNESEAVLVTAIWSFSPALIEVSLEARQYELLGLCTIFFVWSLLRYIDTDKPHSWLRWAALVLTVAAGALTHFHFAIVVAGSVLIFLLKIYKESLYRFVGTICALITGYILFFLLHPGFLRSIQALTLQQNQAAQYYWTPLDSMRRIYATAFTFTRFFVYGGVLQVIVFCLATSLLIWAIWIFLRNRIKLLSYVEKVDWAGISAIYLCLWVSGITILLYLTLISPINAMKPRHMSTIWPFLAFLPILLLRFVPRQKNWLQIVLVGLVLASGVATVYFDYPERPTIMAFGQSNNIVIDTVHRGRLPRIIWQLSDEAKVFAADQSFLLEQPQAWLPQIDQSAKYIGDVAYTSTEEGQEQIIMLLAERLSLKVQKGSENFDVGTMYTLTPQDS